MSATLHMDVPSVTSTQGNIMTVKDSLSTQVASIESAINSMVGSAWIAPGANQFQQDFTTWRGSMSQLLEQLSELGGRLNREIVQWEDVGRQA